MLGIRQKTQCPKKYVPNTGLETSAIINLQVEEYRDFSRNPVTGFRTFGGFGVKFPVIPTFNLQAEPFATGL